MHHQKEGTGMKKIDTEINRRIAEFCGAEEQKILLSTLLGILKNHDSATYFHCVRVALKGIEAANLLGLDPKPLFYAGLLHDFGKVAIGGNVLRKKVGFSESDFDEVKKHSRVGYILLKKMYPFSAEILLRHHRSSARPYPEELPAMSYDAGLIKRYARLLALIDFHDALMNRRNEKFDIDRKDKKAVRALLIEQNKSQEDAINALFENNIF
jgi:response regulator RpfG family c-di-GMP phosphodiesterase